MKKILFLFITCYSGFSYAQFASEFDNRFSIKMSPLGLIDVYGGYSVKLGSEVKIYKNCAVSIEVGKYFNYFDGDGIRDKLKGYIIKPEVKFYLNREGFSSGNYVSVEYQYKETSFNYEDSIQIEPDPTYEKEYRIYKSINCINLKYGGMEISKKGFLVEWFVGVGIRICKGHNTLSKIEDDGILTGENHGSEIGWTQRSFNYVFPNLTLGLKIGYSFK